MNRPISIIAACVLVFSASASTAGAQTCDNGYGVADKVTFCSDRSNEVVVKKIWPVGSSYAESNFRVRPRDVVVEDLTPGGGVCFRWSDDFVHWSPRVFWVQRGRRVNMRFPVIDGYCDKNGHR
jgi:hypothetical protein